MLRPREFPETRASMLSAMREAGQDSAWRTFFACYAPPVFRMARTRGLSHEDADDVVQQVMVAVARHITDFRYDRDRGRFRSWVRTITRSKVNDRLRAALRRREHAAVPFDEERDGEIKAVDEERQWGQEWLLQDLNWCIERVRDEVAPHRFEAFWLYAIEGRPAEEVAQQTGITVGNVYVTRSLIAKRVRELMAELGEEEA
ncbi:MAG: sigma-70 family RNA polymerase sigma factor [Phycisphaerae bacterium]